MSDPTVRTDWANSGSALKTATDSNRWDLGWQTVPDNDPNQTGERPNLNQQNYWQNSVHVWIQYLNAKAIPLGSLMPIASNLAGTYSIPATGVVSAEGWMLCDGAAIPGGNAVSGNTPDLSDERFLRGASTAGSTGGVATLNLAHSHTVNSHTHTGPSHTHSMQNHTHSMSHTHEAGSLHALYNGGSVIYWKEYTVPGWTASEFFTVTTNSTTSNAQTRGIYVEGDTAGASTSNTGGPSTGSTGGGGTGNTGSTAPGTNSQLSASTSIVPKYLNTVYIIKVD